MTQAEQFVEAARACIGTRWIHQGRLPGIGLDCIGLGVVAAAAVGIRIIDSEGYSRTPTGHSLTRGILKNADRIQGPMQAGDVLSLSRVDIPTHVAIYTGNGQIIHSWAGIGRVVEHAFDASWQECLRGVFRPRWIA